MTILMSSKKFKRFGNAFSIGTTPEPPTPPTPDRYVYSSFDAYPIREAFRNIDVSEKWFNYLDVMMISWVKRTWYLWEEVLTEDYLACWEGHGGRPDVWSWKFLVFIQTNSSKEILNWEAKSREELGENYNTYRSAFDNPTQMTDEIWSNVIGYFSSIINVTSDSNYIYVDYNGGTPIIIEKSTHNMKYWQNWLWTSDTVTEYQTLQSNWWLVDWVYEWIDVTLFKTVSSSIKNKSEIAFTITVSTSWWYTTITDWKQSVLYNLANSKFRYNADYYSEENDPIVLSTFTTNGWLQDWQYNYVSVDNKSTQWNDLVEQIKNDGVVNATIEHDIQSKEITITNWDYSITIMDRNLWANYYLWETQNEADSYGSYTNWWCKTLWWGKTEEDWSQTQSIAPNGYHIPSINELQSLINLMKTIRPKTYVSDFKTELLIPFAWGRYSGGGGYSGKGSNAYLWSSTPNGNPYAKEVRITSSAVQVDWWYQWNFKSRGLSVRCFKNT